MTEPPLAPRLLLAELDRLDPVSLDVVESAVGLTRRFDDKFLVEVEALPRLIELLGAGWSVLDVDDRRVTSYRTTYFDTPALDCYMDHLQGRRRRFKVRTRRYGVDGPCVLEVKLKGAAGRTEKARWPRARPVDAELTVGEVAQVEDALHDTYGFGLPAPLRRSVTTSFERAALVNRERQQRITVDTVLVIDGPAGRVAFDPDVAIVEVKGTRRASEAFRTMMHLGHRPMPVSKYCLGIVGLHDSIRGNPWMPTLRRLAMRGSTA